MSQENEPERNLVHRFRDEFGFIQGNFLIMVLSWRAHRLILAMIFVGILNILVGSAISSLSAELIPKEHRGKTNGSSGFFSTIAMSLGQLSGGYLYSNVSHQLPFLIELVFIIPVIYMAWFWIKDPDS